MPKTSQLVDANSAGHIPAQVRQNRKARRRALIVLGISLGLLPPAAYFAFMARPLIPNPNVGLPPTPWRHTPFIGNAAALSEVDFCLMFRLASLQQAVRLSAALGMPPEFKEPRSRCKCTGLEGLLVALLRLACAETLRPPSPLPSSAAARLGKPPRRAAPPLCLELGGQNASHVGQAVSPATQLFVGGTEWLAPASWWSESYKVAHI